MPTWLRVVALGILGLITVIALVPLGYAAYRLIQVGSGEATRYGVRVERASGGPVTDAELDVAVEVLLNRLVELGVTAPVVERSSAPGENVEVMVPFVRDPERVKMLLRTDADLRLQPVVGDARMSVYRTPEEAEASPGFDPAKHEVLPYLERGDESSAAARYLVVERTPVLTGQDLRDARAASDQFKDSNYQINFSLKPAAAERFGAWTGANVGKDLAIMLNGRVMSAPRIQSQINDRGQITGSFSRDQAEDLAIVLRAGHLPGSVTLTSETTVSSNYWLTRYGAVAAGSALVALACLAGAVAIVWPLLRRRPR